LLHKSHLLDFTNAQLFSEGLGDVPQQQPSPWRDTNGSGAATKEELLQTDIWRSQPSCPAGKSVHYKLFSFNGQAIGQVS
jgi:hypothetical protein